MDGQTGITKVPARHVGAPCPDLLLFFLTLLPFMLYLEKLVYLLNFCEGVGSDFSLKIQLVFKGVMRLRHKSGDAIKELSQGRVSYEQISFPQ